ncbi:DUF4249 domain-containing protein [Hymenobacter defluvii]|uniref:DUF4249 domain-containing protein n=1 Tax=Hymenobacter defluvii TaxID=2054411 RepID=A0ABS3TDA9_9BACT|nr:DUF4249 domain-containing protein [Hymenobacter defluvii]MBO3271647.1 DUF4249 domain-containing protein [Hymenobacter defluvii]
MRCFRRRPAAWLLLSLFSPTLLAGCGSLQQDIDVELPFGPSQLVVEAYLEPNVVPRLTITETQPYLAEAVIPLVDDATAIIIRPNGTRDTLMYAPTIDRTTRKGYTHIGRRRLNARPGDIFGLEVYDKQGRRLTGTATVPATVPIQKVEWRFNNETGDQRKAYVLNTFQDPAGLGDAYRFMVHRRSLLREPEVEYTVQDRLTDGQSITLGTSYEFRPNDTLIVSLFHLDTPYYNFLQSVQDARSANNNPFAQPSGVKSTVTGGIGVFTVLSVQRQNIILRE